MKTKPQLAVLTYVVKDKKVLLAKKTRKLFVGQYTGYGGKIDAGETELEAARRELEEESNLKTEISSLEKVAVVDFHNSKTDIWRVSVFVTYKFKGTVKSTEEMQKPKWFDISKLPIENMPWSDVYWLPLLLRYRKKINVEVHKDPFLLKITEMK